MSSIATEIMESVGYLKSGLYHSVAFEGNVLSSLIDEITLCIPESKVYIEVQRNSSVAQKRSNYFLDPVLFPEKTKEYRKKFIFIAWRHQLDETVLRLNPEMVSGISALISQQYKALECMYYHDKDSVTVKMQIFSPGEVDTESLSGFNVLFKEMLQDNVLFNTENFMNKEDVDLNIKNLYSYPLFNKSLDILSYKMQILYSRLTRVGIEESAKRIMLYIPLASNVNFELFISSEQERLLRKHPKNFTKQAKQDLEFPRSFFTAETSSTFAPFQIMKASERNTLYPVINAKLSEIISSGCCEWVRWGGFEISNFVDSIDNMVDCYSSQSPVVKDIVKDYFGRDSAGKQLIVPVFGKGVCVALLSVSFSNLNPDISTVKKILRATKDAGMSLSLAMDKANTDILRESHAKIMNRIMRALYHDERTFINVVRKLVDDYVGDKDTGLALMMHDFCLEKHDFVTEIFADLQMVRDRSVNLKSDLVVKSAASFDQSQNLFECNHESFLADVNSVHQSVFFTSSRASDMTVTFSPLSEGSRIPFVNKYTVLRIVRQLISNSKHFGVERDVEPIQIALDVSLKYLRSGIGKVKIRYMDNCGGILFEHPSYRFPSKLTLDIWVAHLESTKMQQNGYGFIIILKYVKELNGRFSWKNVESLKDDSVCFSGASFEVELESEAK